jgi:hypothetical protein
MIRSPPLKRVYRPIAQLFGIAVTEALVDAHVNLTAVAVQADGGQLGYSELERGEVVGHCECMLHTLLVNCAIRCHFTCKVERLSLLS